MSQIENRVVYVLPGNVIVAGGVFDEANADKHCPFVNGYIPTALWMKLENPEPHVYP